MTPLVVGNPQVFAIESCITEVWEDMDQRALGYFILHIGGIAYGIKRPDATGLGSPLADLRARIARRGSHLVCFSKEPDAYKIADAFLAANFSEARQHESFFGMSCSEIYQLENVARTDWAPDGDEAFDDGSHILHFDVGDKVRLIAVKNLGTPEAVAQSLSEQWLPADEFYGILDEWQRRFDAEWREAVKRI